MKKLSITKAWDDSREILARDGNLFVAVAGALLVLPFTLMTLLAPEATPVTAQNSAGSGFWLMALLSNLIAIVTAIAFAHLTLKRGASVKEAIMDGLSLLLPVLGAVLIWAIPVLLIFSMLFQYALGPNFYEIMVQAETDPQAMNDLQLNGLGFLGIFVAAIAVMYVAMRLSLINPVAVGERLGPIGLLKRSWTLTKGHVLRLIGFSLLAGIAFGIVFLVVQLIAGLVATLLGGVEPLSVGALVFGLSMAVVQAGISVVFAVMLANIYRQLAAADAEPRVSVPPSGDA